MHEVSVAFDSRQDHAKILSLSQIFSVKRDGLPIFDNIL